MIDNSNFLPTSMYHCYHFLRLIKFCNDIFRKYSEDFVHYYSHTMQNFDDLDIEGRNPSHLSEEDKEKVGRKNIIT